MAKCAFSYTLPFDVCKFCPNLSRDVRETNIVDDGKIVAREFTVVCSREQICRNFYDMLEKDNDIVRKAVDDSQN